MMFVHSSFKDIQILCKAIDHLDIRKGDITQYPCDAIVCPDNTMLSGAGGVAKKIHQKAGPLLKLALAKIDGCPIGQIRTTSGFNLNVKFILHTASPAWKGGINYEELQLTNCYSAAMQQAFDLGCRTIAFPSIGTGFHHFPKKRATEIAMGTIFRHLTTVPTAMKVSIICTDDETYEIYKNTLKHMIVKIFKEFYSPENCTINRLSDHHMGPYSFWMLKLRNLETIPHEYIDYVDTIGFKAKPSNILSDGQYYYELSKSAHLWDYRTCLAYIIYLLFGSGENDHLESGGNDQFESGRNRQQPRLVF